MKAESVAVTVSIMGKDYRIACTADQENDLHIAARHLDAKMHEIRRAGKVIGGDKIAVMAALNLTHELLSSESSTQTACDQIQRRLRTLNNKIDDAIGDSKQLEL